MYVVRCGTIQTGKSQPYSEGTALFAMLLRGARMLGFKTELERADSAGDNEAVANPSPATRAVKQREAHLIMDALLREYLSGPPRSFSHRSQR